MVRGDWRERDEDRRDGRIEPPDRDDLGQADYSDDFGYDERARRGYRADERLGDRADDYGQADYSSDWAHDPRTGRSYRRHSEDDPEFSGPARRDPRADDRDRVENGHRLHGRESRSWLDRAGDFLSGGMVGRRRGPSDRVIWAVIAERLERQRGLDLGDVELIVHDAEVTLNGTVRSRSEKRRIEDVADMDEVRHVQNNLRVRNRGRWTFL